MNRLLIFIIGLLGFCVAKSDGLAYSPDGGLNLYAACGNDMVNNVDFLGLYTLGDAQDSLARRKMPKTKRVGLSWIYFDSEVFNEWLIMERMRGPGGLHCQGVQAKFALGRMELR